MIIYADIGPKPSVRIDFNGLEALVIEALFYAKKLPTWKNHYGKGCAVGYACIANIASFVIGLQLAWMIPGIF